MSDAPSRTQLILDHAQRVEAIMASRYERARGLSGDGALSSKDVEDAYLAWAEAHLHLSLALLDVKVAAEAPRGG